MVLQTVLVVIIFFIWSILHTRMRTHACMLPLSNVLARNPQAVMGHKSAVSATRTAPAVHTLVRVALSLARVSKIRISLDTGCRIPMTTRELSHVVSKFVYLVIRVSDSNDKKWNIRCAKPSLVVHMGLIPRTHALSEREFHARVPTGLERSEHRLRCRRVGKNMSTRSACGISMSTPLRTKPPGIAQHRHSTSPLPLRLRHPIPHRLNRPCILRHHVRPRPPRKLSHCPPVGKKYSTRFAYCMSAYLHV
jgi:hypothetical protein